MKYIVEVNAKYLVSVEAESVLSAEHKVLDYKGVWGALAFDRAMMKTDTFAGAVQGCEMISMNDLYGMSDMVATTEAVAKKAIKTALDAEIKVKELEEMLKTAKQAALDANRAKADALYQNERAVDRIGQERR